MHVFMRSGVLVLEGDFSHRRRLTSILRQLSIPAHEVETLAAARRLAAQPIAAIVAGKPQDAESELDVLRDGMPTPLPPVIIVSSGPRVSSAVQAMRLGAADYLAAPVGVEELRRALDRVAEIRVSAADSPFRALIGTSAAMQQVVSQARRAALSDATVLIQGETGTGKELLARAIHQDSPRADHPFVTVDFTSIPRELMETELFGHARGSSNGTFATVQGRVERADGGTLFLDEVGEIPLEMQAQLLRVLQQRELERIGGNGPVRVNVRVLAATNRDLRQMVAAGRFREDLFHRLNVIPVPIPPLRTRPEDIPPLVRHFFEQARRKHGRLTLTIPNAVVERFSDGYAWPGNAREMENVLERVVVLAAGPEVGIEDLPEFLQVQRTALDRLRLAFPAEGIDLAEVERELLRRALEAARENRSQAARLLRISRKTLLYRLQKHGWSARRKRRIQLGD